ncbi:MAG: hypothetical protein ACD_3C00205G0011 [uncultured bacterium (gcode 4)]|uniref:Uncharacterized protein n=1 Tax=uncultured bacterium (gcode 4) TaxID=1234023 RepID=K2FWX0_9BACT|nr:MAG: hypothetical protein ACD_3C00205G0011 [uncultured bacterium (gcode 4)]
MKRCIACDELIWNEALVCIYCWESLVPEIIEDWEYVIIPEHNYEKKLTSWTDNKQIYKDFLPIFWWAIIKEEPEAIEPRKLWSWIWANWEPIETIKQKTNFILKRKKSSVKKEIKNLESDFFNNLLWVCSKKFNRTYGFDILILVLLILWWLQIYWDFKFISINFSVISIAVLLLFYHIDNISAKAKKYEKKRNLSLKKFSKHIQELKKFVISDVLDKYLKEKI